MRIKFKITGNSYDLNFEAEMFSRVKDDYEELELEMYEDIFILLNSGFTRDFKNLSENYDSNYLVKAFLYFGVEKELQIFSDYLQKKEFWLFLETQPKVDFCYLLCSSSLVLEEFVEKHAQNYTYIFSENTIFPKDWHKLGKMTSKSEKITWTFPSSIDWNLVSSNPFLSEDFFEKYLCKIDWKRLSENKGLSAAFFEKHLEKVVWNRIVANSSVSEDFFERHADKINWTENSLLYYNPSVSLNFFERHSHVRCASLCAGRKDITEDFLERHFDSLTWDMFSSNSRISEAFIEKNLDKLQLSAISNRPDLSESFIEKYIVSSNVHVSIWKNIARCNISLSEDFWEKYASSLSSLIWTDLSKNPSLSEAFFEKQSRKVDWCSLSVNPSLSEAFFEKHKKAVKWRYISANPSMSEKFFDKRKSRLNWSLLFENCAVSEKFIEKNIEKYLGKIKLTQGRKFSLEFMKRNAKYITEYSPNCLLIKPWREFFLNYM